MSTDNERLDVLIAEMRECEDPDQLNVIFDELAEMAGRPAARELLVKHRNDLDRDLRLARERCAACTARLALVHIAAGDIAEVSDSHVDFAASAPHGEIALAAFHLMEHSRVMVQYDDRDALGDPRFDSYPSIYAHATAHVTDAAYYLLEPGQSAAALASEPPQTETFPPLPFTRVWIEMAHLAPFMRFTIDESTHSHLDVLGVGIHEIEPGRVWDIYLPIQFDDRSEFFYVAERIAPDRIIDADPALEAAAAALDRIRQLVVGGVHLITARNAPTVEVTLPRAQRRRLERAATYPARLPSLYFVDIGAAGEHETGDSGRVYTVRWLVRGHWRHTDGGRTFCTCCDPPQIASWVAAYIKGPAGAPWKGRQVRRKIPA